MYCLLSGNVMCVFIIISIYVMSKMSLISIHECDQYPQVHKDPKNPLYLVGQSKKYYIVLVYLHIQRYIIFYDYTLFCIRPYYSAVQLTTQREHCAPLLTDLYSYRGTNLLLSILISTSGLYIQTTYCTLWFSVT